MNQIEAEVVEIALPGLVDLLCDAVDGGASVGFLAPLQREEAAGYWRTVAAAVHEGSRIVIAAFDDSGLIGSVQLGLEMRVNGRHRAEVMKLITHRRARRRGVGAALMKKAEDVATSLGLTLLVLDTRAGDDAERLYTNTGWTRVGTIPRFALSSAGEMTDTVIFYKELSKEKTGP